PLTTNTPTAHEPPTNPKPLQLAKSSTRSPSVSAYGSGRLHNARPDSPASTTTNSITFASATSTAHTSPSPAWFAFVFATTTFPRTRKTACGVSSNPAIHY